MVNVAVIVEMIDILVRDFADVGVLHLDARRHGAKL
jgi:hypothetical protein